MLRKVLLLGAIILLVSTILPSVAICVPFEVDGAVIVDGSYYELNGTMDINEPVVDDHGNISFTYYISEFNLEIGDESYTGNSSYINSIYYQYPDDSFTCEFDVFLLASDDGAINWQILSAGAVFYDENGIAYQDSDAPTDFYDLPYKIEATNIADVDVYFEHLNIERVAPVPEPATILLLSLGLFGGLLYNRKNS